MEPMDYGCFPESEGGFDEGWKHKLPFRPVPHALYVKETWHNPNHGLEMIKAIMVIRYVLKLRLALSKTSLKSWIRMEYNSKYIYIPCKIPSIQGPEFHETFHPLRVIKVRGVDFGKLQCKNLLRNPKLKQLFQSEEIYVRNTLDQ
ncbi:hypothetical protein TNIN_320811 [Trichonephila inaurata madagascariensis]|uniref:Uncharacterized protein n=1 Tax=Trichonephila inaurata madagascariensis TaxID=2747483 RepID=A0A8X6YL46_9ARAC|nr:hypothetical protein TNIN_320811 [Trichonephila inaurata madagascariensis]